MVKPAQEVLPEEPQLVQPQSPVKEVVANEHLTYRQNSYLVQHYRLDGVDRYNIFNEGTGKAISPSSVTGRSILKKYKTEKPTGMEEPEKAASK